MKTNLSVLIQSAKQAEAENKKFFAGLKNSPPKDFDRIVSTLHEKVFENIDCLKCANCCKSISPVITDKDIERIARFMKMRPALFTAQFLHIDEDGDYVFNDTPCPFLCADNCCNIYSARPKACAGYPHTGKRRFIQISDLTIKNTFICPAAFEVVEKLKEKFRRK